jgi:hypothetical protein
MNIIFDDINHAYYIDGVRLPSVTQILKAEGYYGWLSDNDFAMRLGREVHMATELLDRNDLADYSPDVWYAPYLEAYKKFKSDYAVEIKEIEIRAVSKTWAYAGTVDRIAIVKGKLAIYDLKTGSPRPCTALQTAGYKIAVEEMKIAKIQTRWGVLLQNDGTYIPEEYENKGDENVFKSIVVGHHWKRNHNITKEAV